MSNLTEKTMIANIALLNVGQNQITSLTASSVEAIRVNSIFEEVVSELLEDDWNFNRKRVHLDDMVQVFKLEIDSAPTPAVFKVGATLTGVTSGVTCTVMERLSDTIYLVTKPSSDFTDGEVIGDGTNSRNCAASYPEVSETLDHGTWSYGYVKPTDQLYQRGLGDESYDKLKYPFSPEGQIIFTNIQDAYWHYNKWVGENESTTVSDVTATRKWFKRLISARISYLLSPNITQNTNIRPKAEKELAEAWRDAREKNGEETYHDDEQGNTDWRDGANATLNSIR